VISKYGNKTTCKDWFISRELSQTFVDRKTALQWPTLYYFDHKAAKGKKGTIVTITGTKAQTVVAIIEKHSLNDEIQFLK
jgi:phage I-like protein